MSCTYQNTQRTIIFNKNSHPSFEHFSSKKTTRCGSVVFHQGEGEQEGKEKQS